MKQYIKCVMAFVVFCCLSLLLGGCGGSTDTVYKYAFTASKVQSILIDYDGECVLVTESPSSEITITEQLNRAHKSYLAEVALSDSVLTIAEGTRPIGNGVTASLEIALPSGFHQNLSIHTTNGRIIISSALTLSSFHADTTNGSIEVASLTADNLSLETTGGQIYAQALTGGGSVLSSGDGDLDLKFTNVTDNLSIYAKNGDISLSLPADLNFYLSTVSKNGLITAPLQEDSSPEQADITVEVESKNGDINVYYS